MTKDWMICNLWTTESKYLLFDLMAGTFQTKIHISLISIPELAVYHRAGVNQGVLLSNVTYILWPHVLNWKDKWHLKQKEVNFLQAQMLVIDFRIHNSYLKFLSVPNPFGGAHMEKLGIKISWTAYRLSQPCKSLECGMEHLESLKSLPHRLITITEIPLKCFIFLGWF